MLIDKKIITLLLALNLNACVIPIMIPLPNTGAVYTLYGQWQITELAAKPVNNPQAQLHFYSVNPQFSAKTDCNQIFGGFTTNTNNQLIFSDLAATRMACTDNIIERTLQKTLPQVRQYRIYGNELEMNDGNGTILLRAHVLKNRTAEPLNHPASSVAAP